MPHLLIDTDPGTDDAIALLMALNAPDAEVAGVTTVGGNASLSHVTKNALAVLEHMGRTSVPVAKGAAISLAGDPFRYAYDFHGHRGLGVHMLRPTAAAVREDAVSFMAARILEGFPLAVAERGIEGERSEEKGVTLVALGPLTNVARLLQQYPHAAQGIARLVVMGGALDQGNVTPYAEFNTYNDPEAASAVFASGVPITLVPLDACAQVTLSAKDLARWRDSKAPAARLADRILLKWFQRQTNHQAFDPCDPLAMAVALAPDIASYEHGSVTVDTSAEETRGRTLFQPGSGNVSVARRVDAAAFYALLDELLLRGG
ncbi:MAG: nucleoside hydrolase [Chloroflexi bacterium]|nr:nucleoside hydrolase [Chloroflexota bacterium]